VFGLETLPLYATMLPGKGPGKPAKSKAAFDIK